MTNQEFSDAFDILYSREANTNDTIDEYQKSVYLTKAQQQILHEYFETPSGPNSMPGFDGSAKRQIDFSSLTRTKVFSSLTEVEKATSPYPTLHLYKANMGETKEGEDESYDEQIMYFISEMITVTQKGNSNAQLLQVIPITKAELMRVLSKPYGQPLKRQAWRILNVTTRNKAYSEINEEESDAFYQEIYLVVHSNEEAASYTLSYIKRPQPIILLDISDTSLTIEGRNTPSSCELDPTIHQEILERAVTLAKIAAAGSTSSIPASNKSKGDTE